jgi:hypothetical protein
VSVLLSRRMIWEKWTGKEMMFSFVCKSVSEWGSLEGGMGGRMGLSGWYGCNG